MKKKIIKMFQIVFIFRYYKILMSMLLGPTNDINNYNFKNWFELIY